MNLMIDVEWIASNGDEGMRIGKAGNTTTTKNRISDLMPCHFIMCIPTYVTMVMWPLCHVSLLAHHRTTQSLTRRSLFVPMVKCGHAASGARGSTRGSVARCGSLCYRAVSCAKPTNRGPGRLVSPPPSRPCMLPRRGFGLPSARALPQALSMVLLHAAPAPDQRVGRTRHKPRRYHLLRKVGRCPPPRFSGERGSTKRNVQRMPYAGPLPSTNAHEAAASRRCKPSANASRCRAARSSGAASGVASIRLSSAMHSWRRPLSRFRAPRPRSR